MPLASSKTKPPHHSLLRKEDASDEGSGRLGLGSARQCNAALDKDGRTCAPRPEESLPGHVTQARAHPGPSSTRNWSLALRMLISDHAEPSGPTPCLS